MLDITAVEARPPRATLLPFAPPTLGPEEKEEILAVLDSGWITTGPRVEQFQQRMAEYLGVGQAVAVSSCTAALHLAIVAHGIGEGDEVILPTYTFASTAHVVMYQRARPVFVDINLHACNVDPERVEGAITPRTKAIIPVHYAGHPCDLDAIFDIARRHGLVVIEDAAHAIGAEYNGRKVGSFGSTACFSFYATKNITTAEGGMVTTADAELAERIRVLSMYGISDARRIWTTRYAPRGSWFYDVQHLGFKYNLTDLQAALGLHQLAKLEQFIARRAHFAQLYDAGFADLKELVRPTAQPGIRHAWHLYSILLRTEQLSITRDDVIDELRRENIGTSVLFRPLHLHSFYRDTLGYAEGQFPNAEHAFMRTLSLPMAPRMSDDDVLDVIGAVRRVVFRHRR